MVAYNPPILPLSCCFFARGRNLLYYVRLVSCLESCHFLSSTFLTHSTLSLHQHFFYLSSSPSTFLSLPLFILYTLNPSGFFTQPYQLSTTDLTPDFASQASTFCLTRRRIFSSYRCRRDTGIKPAFDISFSTKSDLKLPLLFTPHHFLK